MREALGYRVLACQTTEYDEEYESFRDVLRHSLLSKHLFTVLSTVRHGQLTLGTGEEQCVIVFPNSYNSQPDFVGMLIRRASLYGVPVIAVESAEKGSMPKGLRQQATIISASSISASTARRVVSAISRLVKPQRLLASPTRPFIEGGLKRSLRFYGAVLAQLPSYISGLLPAVRWRAAKCVADGRVPLDSAPFHPTLAWLLRKRTVRSTELLLDIMEDLNIAGEREYHYMRSIMQEVGKRWPDSRDAVMSRLGDESHPSKQRLFALLWLGGHAKAAVEWGHRNPERYLWAIGGLSLIASDSWPLEEPLIRDVLAKHDVGDFKLRMVSGQLIAKGIDEVELYGRGVVRLEDANVRNCTNGRIKGVWRTTGRWAKE